jgi:hypothetical protein
MFEGFFSALFGNGFDATHPQAGIPARGLVLQSARIATGTTVNGRRFEQRAMTLDIEIPGQQPYICTGTFLVPRGLVEAIPGASLDVSVDPTNAQNIVVVGPGGFTGLWLNLGPPNPY